LAGRQTMFIAKRDNSRKRLADVVSGFMLSCSSSCKSDSQTARYVKRLLFTHLDEYQKLVLEDTAVNQSLKETFLALRQTAESESE
jgi:hypothetical protein